VTFGLSMEKLFLIGIIALFLIGPDRLPAYSAQLARLIRRLREMASGAKGRMREELGPDYDDVDWKKLDPRQYDPRRIIREALTESAVEPEAAAALQDAATPGVVAESASQQRSRRNPGSSAPFDPDVT
jgi:sec-independent protein translocase protein TatB